jgi:hypothetical protein
MQGVLLFIAGLLCGAFVGFSYHAIVQRTSFVVVKHEPVLVKRVSTSRCYNTTCTLYNFCIASHGGIFPRYNYTGTFPVRAQVATFTSAGQQPMYEGFNPRGVAAGVEIKERPVLLAVAPAAWPNKFPAHTILNNFVPILSQLQWLEPDRLKEDNRWAYQVDIVARCCAYAGGHITHPEQYRWLGKVIY